jgi:fructoselysine-6-P-deglycase FrlB-like protein
VWTFAGRSARLTRVNHVSTEIAAQPEAWQRAVDLLPTVRDALPQPGERVAVIGCGTSWFMAEAYAGLREAAGQGETDFFTAAALPSGRRYDRLLAITRSGTTTEVLDALSASGTRRSVVTADAATPVVGLAEDCVVLDFADEQSVVQTVFATTTLMLLRASLGIAPDRALADVRRVLDGEPDRSLDEAEQYTFLGQDWVHGLAREAALKCREAAQLWTEAYPQLEYRHGPIAIAEPGRVVWVLGDPVPGLLDDLGATGARVVCDDLDPVADLVRAQLLAVRRAVGLGLDPDRPRSLTRSVVLGAS